MSETTIDSASMERPEAVTRYLRHIEVERHLAARSLQLYTEALQRLTALAREAGLRLDQLQSHHVRRFAATLHAGGLGPRSMALELSAWRGFFRWWGRQGEIKLNPVDGVRAPKAGRPLPKALPVDQAVALAEHQPETGNASISARDHCIVELLYGCGLRVSELIGLDVQASPTAAGWLDLDDAAAHVLGKGGRRRTAPIGQPALKALRAWLVERGTMARPEEPALFVSNRGTRLSTSQVRTRLKALAVEAGLPTSVHPHMLRHSYASHLLQSSGDLRGVQELLGHANISTTQIYTKLDFQHLARVYDAAHPRAQKRGGSEK